MRAENVIRPRDLDERIAVPGTFRRDLAADSQDPTTGNTGAVAVYHGGTPSRRELRRPSSADRMTFSARTGLRRSEFEAAVRPGTVVMLDVGGEDRLQVPAR